jgi:hypothetical protein
MFHCLLFVESENIYTGPYQTHGKYLFKNPNLKVSHRICILMTQLGRGKGCGIMARLFEILNHIINQIPIYLLDMLSSLYPIKLSNKMNLRCKRSLLKI